MKVSLYVRLSLMMFLQYAIWGAWMPVLSAYLGGAGFSGKMIGLIYCLLPLGILLSPVTGGQLADRYMPAQWLLVIANGIGAVALYMSSTFDYGAMPAGTAFWTLAGLLLLFSILYGPTLPLTNAVCFRHMSNIEKDFGKIRVWGTIGWMAAGLMLTAWRQESVVAETAKQAATWYGTIWNPISHSAGLSLVRLFGKTKPTDMLLLAAAFSALMAVLCTTLPDTPPERKGVEPLAFKKAFRMLRDTNFLIFMIISFVVTTVMWFYFIQTAPFLESIGVPRTDVPGWIATAQIGEIIAMVILLPLLLPRLGVRLCLVVGVLAWTIRYVVFTIGQPVGLVLASLPIHGLCYVFFFVVGMIYSDNVSPRDIRASVQSLWAVFVLGIGAIVGSYLAGWMGDLFTVNKVVNYRGVFLVPLVVTIVCALAFLLFFREPEKSKSVEKGAA